MHVNYKLSVLIVLITTCVFGCSASKVVKYLNEDASFKNYHTFRIVNFKTENKEYSEEGNALSDSVETFITSAMVEKGYNRQESKADLYVRYELISGVETKVNYNNNYYGNGFGGYSPYYDPYRNRTTTTQRIEGILLLEIKERRSQKLVWQGSLDLKYSRRKDNNIVLLQDAVQTIFETYPYQAGKSLPISTQTK